MECNKDICMYVCLQIRNLRERGQEFLQVPDTYYEILRERLKADKVNLIEDLDVLQVCTP
jgi:4-hydroxyphenylpyruvate dioxygenase-like putative hemolysin